MIFPHHITEDFMPRKRTSTDTPSAENTNVTPDSPAPLTAAAATEPPVSPPSEPAAENTGGRSFAERVGQNKRAAIPDPFGIAADYIAGVRLFESKQHGEVAIKFNEKPGKAVLDKMHEARWQWNPADRIWAHPVRPGSALSTRIEAEQLYQEVREIIRREKGLETGPEVPF
jgi:hypothetical protein